MYARIFQDKSKGVNQIPTELVHRASVLRHAI